MWKSIYERHSESSGNVRGKLRKFGRTISWRHRSSLEGSGVEQRWKESESLFAHVAIRRHRSRSEFEFPSLRHSQPCRKLPNGSSREPSSFWRSSKYSDDIQSLTGAVATSLETMGSLLLDPLHHDYFSLLALELLAVRSMPETLITLHTTNEVRTAEFCAP